jgi:integrase
MTPLRKRLLDDLQLKGYSERTQEMYIRAVRQLAEHYRKSPDKISEEELRQYFLHAKNVRNWSRSTSTIALCGIKFFYVNTLKRNWTTLSFVRPQKEKKLPTILTQKEVKTILGNIRLLRYRICLTTIQSVQKSGVPKARLQLPLMRQSKLPEMRTRPDREMADQTKKAAVTGTIFSGYFYASCSIAHHCTF